MLMVRKVEEIAADFPGAMGDVSWAPDGKSLLVLSEDFGVIAYITLTSKV